MEELDLVGNGRRDVWKFEDDLPQIDLRRGYVVSVNEGTMKLELSQQDAGRNRDFIGLTRLRGSS